MNDVRIQQHEETARVATEAADVDQVERDVALKDERAVLRRAVLSYKYEVDRLFADYKRLHHAYATVAIDAEKALRQHNKMVGWLSGSRAWRLFQTAVRAWHKVRYRTPYRNLMQEVAVPKIVAPTGLVSPRPELPSIPALDYVPYAPPAEKTWGGTHFLSFYYYNEIDRILARQPEGKRKIFVQSPIIDWFVPLYQRPQHMALAMANQGYLVFYVTANTLGDRAAGFHEVAPNVFITNQPAHEMAKGALVSCYSTVATLLSWQGGTAAKIRSNGGTILYEYIDHIDPEISFHTTSQLARQFALVDDDHVDLALASATSLQEELAGKLARTPIAYVPNGVNTEHYGQVLLHDRRSTVPPSLRPVMEAGRPIVGYFGAMAPWLWYPLLNELAESRPDLSFVFIGPDYLGGSKMLEARENVYAIGAVDYALLPYHAQHFDVATIPFKPGDIAKTTSPLKLFEYLALGKPVVVTEGMLECQQFNEVLTAGSVEEYSSAIDLALKRSDDQDFVRRCLKLARKNTWDARAASLGAAHDLILNSTKDKT